MELAALAPPSLTFSAFTNDPRRPGRLTCISLPIFYFDFQLIPA